MTIHRTFSVACCIFSAAIFFSGNDRTIFEDKEQPFSPVTLDQADSLMSSMSIDEKIAQFFIVKSKDAESEIAPFGMILNHTNYADIPLNHKSQVPMIFGLDLLHDLELNQKLDLVSPFQLASIKNDQLIQEYGYALGKSLKNQGFDFILGIALDVESNDESPYTDAWSLGDEAENVIQKSTPYLNGLKSSGILTIAGSYPGLGSTTRGFENSPSIIYAKRKELNAKHLVPFKSAINDGIQSILMSNAFVPGLDSTLNTIASSSPIIINQLKSQMGFNGLVWSDLTCGGNSNIENRVGESFLAGNDLIVIDHELQQNIDKIKDLIEKGIIDEEYVDVQCKKVLQSKLWLFQKNKKQSDSDIERTNQLLNLKKRQLYSQGLVLLRNSRALLPLKDLDTLNIAIVKIGSVKNNDLETLAHRYSKAQVFNIQYETLEADYQNYSEKSSEFNLTIIIAEPSNDDLNRKRFEMSEHCQSVIERISTNKLTALVWNGNSKALRYLSSNVEIETILAGHDPHSFTDDLSIQAVFGGRTVNGELHRKIDEIFTPEGVSETSKIRLAYGLPEEVGINFTDLKKIDTIAKKGIDEMAYPGCQVWFAKDGVVVIDKAYGNHTYEHEHAVKTTDLYDLASITKIAGSVAGLMKLSDNGSFNLDYRLCDYLSEWVDTTSYMQLTMREILAHQAGLTPFIPFYSKTISKGIPRYDVYSLAQSETYPLRVAREFYIRGDYPDKMFREIINYKLSPEKKYKYSDIGYYFALRIIEAKSGMPMNEFLDATFYKPLGLNTMGYRPLERFSKDQITPTEFDRTFRNQLIHGDVHDPGAAMLGGVGGHAGLFSNANDLGVLMQMYLNKGTYGGHQFFSPEVIDDYVRCQFCDNENRRGAGFDKPTRDGSAGPSCGCTDLEAFGHQGFTGTVTWADPGENVVYVFLSNRIYPSVGNKKLLDLNIRTDIQKAFYQAIEKGKDLASE